jgi:hypothetical protein
VRRVIAPKRGTHPIESTVPMKPGATTWDFKRLGRRVTYGSGMPWRCFDCEPPDTALQLGQTHLCAKRSALSIHALSPSVVRLA